MAKAAFTAPNTLSKLCEAAALTDAFGLSSVGTDIYTLYSQKSFVNRDDITTKIFERRCNSIFVSNSCRDIINKKNNTEDG